MNETDANTALATLVDLATQDERKGLPSASSWRRYELCPGSHTLAQEARRLGQEAYSEPSQASDRGERIHAALADQEAELDESEITTFQFLRERADDQARRIFGEEPITELKEQRLWFKLGGQPVASGRFDRVVHNGKVALVQDFKTGWEEPEPAEINAQLKFLSVLVAMHLPQLTEVVAQIVSGPYGVSETRFDLPKLALEYNDVVKTVRKLRDPQAGFNPSPEACKRCPAALICQATKNLIKPITRLQYAELPDGPRAAKLLDEVELLARQLEEIRDYYKRRITEDPQYAIPGWGLEVGAPRRQVKDWVSARAKLEEFIDEGKLSQLADYSIPAIERLLGQAIGTRGAKTKEQLANILGDLLEQKYPAPSLRRLKGEAKITSLTDV